MQNENKINKPIYLLILTFVLAAVLSFFPKDMQLFGLDVKHVDIFADLKQSEIQEPELEYTPDDTIIEDDEYQYDGEMEIIEEEENDTSSKIDQPNINKAGFNFNVFEFLSDADNGPENVQGRKQKLTGYVSQMKSFYQALANSKKQQVRIAHFGDSMIEGDLISADLRELFQQNYGGKGVGWLSITSQDTKFRQSTRHTFSNTWEMYSLYTNNPQRMPLGISGEIFLPKQNSWVEYKGTRKFRTMRNYDVVKLYYSHAKNVSIDVKLGRKSEKAKLNKGNSIQELKLEGSRIDNVRFEIPRDAGYFYGASLESKTGVILDNFPLRGNSGVDLQEIGEQELSDFSKYMDYDLIILEFGLNAIGAVKDWRWYEREMGQVITKFKKAFPNTSILMISTHDRATRKGGKFVTEPEIFKLLKAQQNIAKDNKVAFWNFFEAMGGQNSMDSWVTSNPPLAFKDYVHFNDQGAKKVAELLFESIEDGK